MQVQVQPKVHELEQTISEQQRKIEELHQMRRRKLKGSSMRLLQKEHIQQLLADMVKQCL